jgi:hypothetical protein
MKEMLEKEAVLEPVAALELASPLRPTTRLLTTRVQALRHQPKPDHQEHLQYRAMLQPSQKEAEDAVGREDDWHTNHQFSIGSYEHDDIDDWK